MIIWMSGAMGRRISVPQGYIVFGTDYKKLFISKRQVALAIFGSILLNAGGVGLCVAAIHNMNKTSYLDVPVTRSSAP